MAIPSSTYTELVTTTLASYRGVMADNVLTHNALLNKLKSKGNAEPVGGGTTILENLMYAQNSTGLWYSGLDYLDVSASDVMTSANFDWKELNVNVVMSGLDKAKNSGTKESVFKLVRERIKNAEITLQNMVAVSLFNSNTENSGKAIGGLQYLVADLPTASATIGGIAQDTQSFWRNQFYDFSTQAVTASATTIQAAMNQVFINATRGKDMIEMWVGGTTYFNYYLTSLQAQQQFVKNDTAGAGFASLTYWGGVSEVFFDANCSATRMYGLCPTFLHFRPHSDYNFVTSEDKSAINQDATVVPLFFKGNLTVSNRARQGVVCA